MSINYSPTLLPDGYNTASQDQTLSTAIVPNMPSGYTNFPMNLKTYLMWPGEGQHNVMEEFLPALMTKDMSGITAYASPIDAIISCGYIPFSPPATILPQQIYIGNVGMGLDITATVVSKPVNYELCGQFNYQKKGYYDSFLDYSPYTTASIYLPYIGWRDVDASLFYDAGRRDAYGQTMWDYLDIYYNYNVITGSLVVTLYGRKMDASNPDLTVSNIVLYQFTGSGMETIPLTQQQASTKMQSTMTCIMSGASGAAAIIGGIATGNPMMIAGGVGAALGGIAHGVMQGANPNADLSTRGTITGEFGSLLPTNIYLLLKTPKQAMPEYMNQTEGITSNVGKLMSQLTNSGFNALSTFHLDGFSCLDDEKEELAALFRAGCIF